jgi:lipopolysaccharide transport system ATP-binding protein
MTTAIKVENLSKAYQLGTIGTGTISRDIHRWWTTKILGNEDPFLKIGETNDRSTKGTSDIVWSLKDINFEIEQGDAVGIIGKNGAGKSTLLKLLSRVTAPTTGSVKVKGRVASLLEVGTGFHPELTGRENIYLNGAILGMRKKEITRKLDEIIDFSGVERYIDTPVKRYSSGMYVRLAFAVAAHLESEILIVDEVLAVGDAEFQKKCLGKMGEVSQGEGRTVLFVSHNLTSIKNICKTGILLNNGILACSADITQTIIEYTKKHQPQTSYKFSENGLKVGNENIQIFEFTLKPTTSNLLSISSGIDFSIKFFNKKQSINLALGMIVKTNEDTIVTEIPIIITQFYDSHIGLYEIHGKIPSYTLNAGEYSITLLFGENQKHLLFTAEEIVDFKIENEIIGSNIQPLPGLLRLNPIYKILVPNTN